MGIAITLGRAVDTNGLFKKAPAEAVVDDIFVFSDGVDKWELVDKKGVYNARHGGVLPGSNQTTRLNAIFAHADVKEVLLDSGDITISGTLNCQNKKVVFRNNGKMIGAGTVQNHIIDADYQSNIFATTLTHSGAKSASDMVSAKWFGAVGDNTTNDQPAIQKAIDTIVANDNLPKELFLPRGRYKIDAPLIVYKWDGSQYLFTSVNIIGAEAAGFTDDSVETTIRLTATDTFAIGYQRVRTSKIKGVSILGPFQKTGVTLEQYYEGSYSTWASMHGVRDTAYSPLAGVVIDPFRMDSGALPADGGYPGLSAWYRGNTQGGSSNVIISDCRFTGFTVAILNSPNFGSFNAENIYVSNVAIEHCKVGFASCQRQEKNNSIKNLISWGNVHTLIDGVSYGQGQGCPPNIDGVNIAGNTIRIFNISVQFNVTIKNVFAEALYRVGILHTGFGRIAMQGCYIDFLVPGGSANPNGLMPTAQVQARNVDFNDCTFRYYDDLFNKRIVVDGYGNKFSGCWFDMLPLSINYSEDQKGISNTFIDCRTNTEYIGPTHFKGGVEIRDISIIPTVPMTLEYGVNSQYFSSEVLEIKPTEPNQLLAISGNSHTIPATRPTATITSSLVAYLENTLIGEYVIGYNTTSPKYQVIGRLTAINRTTGEFTITEIPYGINSTDQYTLYSVKIRKITNGFVFDATNGSDVLTNFEGNTWNGYTTDAVGQVLPGIGAYAGFISSQHKLIQPARQTKSNLYKPPYGTDGDGQCREVLTSILAPNTYASYIPTSTKFFSKDTIWVTIPFSSFGDTVRFFKFTTPGYINASAAGKVRQAVWVECDRYGQELSPAGSLLGNL